MKNFTLLAASILIMTSAANATALKTTTDVVFTTHYNNNEPISFIERGIEFFVFTNGDFDFNTRPDDSNGDYQYKSAGRRSANVKKDNLPLNYGVLVEQDSFGRVRRVGNTFINYDYNDRVTRIGSVYIKYNQFTLVQVGGLKIIYNRHGEIVDTVGSVKGRRYQGYTYNNHYNNYEDCDANYPVVSNNNDNYYYYKADGTKAKVEEKK